MSLRIKFNHNPAIRISRIAIKARKFVYIARANKRIRYPLGRSSIVYVGMTKVGVSRVAQSAAKRGKMILNDRGLKYLEFFLVTNTKLPGLASWAMLEKAIAIKFREIYGEAPLLNSSYSKAKWGKERKYFNPQQLEKVIKAFESPI